MRLGFADAIQERPTVALRRGRVEFDIGIEAAGSLQHIVEITSFRKSLLAEVEHLGAWFTKVWPEASAASGAAGHLLVEPGDTDEAGERAQRVEAWASDAGIEVIESPNNSALVQWAESLARRLDHTGLEAPLARNQRPRTQN
jgi:hypothetical protein